MSLFEADAPPAAASAGRSDGVRLKIGEGRQDLGHVRKSVRVHLWETTRTLCSLRNRREQSDLWACPCQECFVAFSLGDQPRAVGYLMSK